jgi:hypothetical protein
MGAIGCHYVWQKLHPDVFISVGFFPKFLLDIDNCVTSERKKNISESKKKYTIESNFLKFSLFKRNRRLGESLVIREAVLIIRETVVLRAYTVSV